MLIDTSGLLCLIHRREPEHEKAVSLYEASTLRITHNYVLAELIALGHSRNVPRRSTLDFSERILNEAKVETIWVDKLHHAAALKLLRARPDKSYSLCDAVSFVIMRERNISEALTTDRHFAQEGFLRLLK
jgi:predicted nucleic acid-binding protein